MKAMTVGRQIWDDLNSKGNSSDDGENDVGGKGQSINVDSPVLEDDEDEGENIHDEDKGNESVDNRALDDEFNILAQFNDDAQRTDEAERTNEDHAEWRSTRTVNTVALSHEDEVRCIDFHREISDWLGSVMHDVL